MGGFTGPTALPNAYSPGPGARSAQKRDTSEKKGYTHGLEARWRNRLTQTRGAVTLSVRGNSRILLLPAGSGRSLVPKPKAGIALKV